MDWYVYKLDTSEQLGPLRRRDLLRMRDGGELTPEDLVFSDGVLPDWTPAGKIRQLFYNGGYKWKYPLPHLRDPRRRSLYVVEDASRRGPYSVNELQRLLDENKLDASAVIFDQDGQKNMPLAEVIGPNSGSHAPVHDDATLEIETDGLLESDDEPPIPVETFSDDDQLLIPLDGSDADLPVALREDDDSDGLVPEASSSDDHLAPMVITEQVDDRSEILLAQIIDDDSDDNLHLKDRDSPPVARSNQKHIARSHQNHNSPAAHQKPARTEAPSPAKKSAPRPARKQPATAKPAENPDPEREKLNELLQQDESSTSLPTSVLPRASGKKSLPPLPPRVRTGKGRKHPPKQADREINRESGSKAVRKLIYSREFSQAFLAWTVIYALQGMIYLTVSSSVFSMFIRRIGVVCLNTFVPFESTPEEIRGEGLLAAGMSTAMIGVGVAYPLWYVLRTDCIPWLSVAAGAIGILVGFGIQPAHLPFLMMAAKFTVVFSGIGAGMVAFWLIGSTRNATVSAQLLLPTGAAALGIIAMFFVNHQQLFVANLAPMPPTIQGSALSAVLFVLGSWLVTCSFPAFCIRAMYNEVDDASKQFMGTHIIATLVCGAIGLTMTFCLANPQPESFMSIPFALVFLAAINTVISLVPPVMWMITPDSVLHRSY